ncbi:MAG TPA: hypothetical protein VM123_19975 [archaeon]|nr:hypothetical protein [archaeon]
MIRINDNEDSLGALTINRAAVVLQPTKLFLEWARHNPEGDPGLTLKELREDTSVYLIPDVDEAPETYIERHYMEMFELELESWCTDESLWPEDLSFKAFKSFFNIRIHSIVFDLCEEPISKES